MRGKPKKNLKRRKYFQTDFKKRSKLKKGKDDEKQTHKRKQHSNLWLVGIALPVSTLHPQHRI